MSLFIKYQPNQSLSEAGNLDGKPKIRIREQLRRLNTIKEPEPVQNASVDPIKPSQNKFLRQKSGELSSISPYASAVRFPLQRSKSFAKVRCRPYLRKTVSPEKNKAICKLGPLGKSLLPSYFTQSRKKKNDTSFCSQSLILSDAVRFEEPFAQKMDVSPNDSFSTSMSVLPGVESPHNPRDSSLTRKLKILRATLTHDLKETSQQAPSDWRSEMRVLSKAFSSVIALDCSLAAVLEEIKAKYEGWIVKFADSYAKEVAKAQGEMADLQNSLLKEIEEKRGLKRKFEKISRECVELNKSCELYQNKCFEFQEKLFDIASVKLEQYPPTETAWKLLNSELETYKSWKEGAVKEIRFVQSKERKLLDLLHALKKRGYPVEDVYNADVKKLKKPCSTPHSECSETEPICSGLPINRPRPVFVPELKMATVEPDVSSASHCSSRMSTLHDSENAFILDQSWSGKSRPTQETSESNDPREKKSKENQPAESGGCPDFLSKLDEASESWRMVLEAEKE